MKTSTIITGLVAAVTLFSAGSSARSLQERHHSGRRWRCPSEEQVQCILPGEDRYCCPMNHVSSCLLALKHFPLTLPSPVAKTWTSAPPSSPSATDPPGPDPSLQRQPPTVLHTVTATVLTTITGAPTTTDLTLTLLRHLPQNQNAPMTPAQNPKALRHCPGYR